MIWSTFEGFVLLDYLKGVFNLGKMSKGRGFWACQKCWSSFLGSFNHFRLFQSPRINFSVQRPSTFLEANLYDILRCFVAFCKMSQVTRKSASRLPKIEGGGLSQFGTWSLEWMQHDGLARSHKSYQRF